MPAWLKTVAAIGGGVVANVVPGGAAIVGLINEFLPADDKLPATATGQQAADAISRLPPELQASLQEKLLDVQMATVNARADTLQAMLASDSTAKHTTRPKIAYQAFQVTGFSIIAVVAIWCYAVVMGNPDMVAAVQNGWPFVLSATAPFIALLQAYFGILKTEHANKLASATGQPHAPTGVIGSIMKAIKG